MNPAETLQKISESLTATASVKTVFGDPIQMEGKTVVPVAKVAYGFGAGGGRGPVKENGEHPEGGGGGGGVRAFPAGALEITPTQTRFVPYNDLRWLAGAFTAGLVLSRIFFRRS